MSEGRVGAAELGGHKIAVEADLICIATQGPFSMAEIEKVYQDIAAVVREHGAAYLLVDARGGISCDHAQRRQLTQLGKATPPSAIAVFGATLPQQAMLILLSSAMRVMRGKRVPLRFSRNETEARAWLLSQRPAVR